MTTTTFPDPGITASTTAVSPILSVLWRGHRIEVHGDREVSGQRGGRHVDPIGTIALAIAGATSPGGIRQALDDGPLGETHRARVELVEGRIEVHIVAR